MQVLFTAFMLGSCQSGEKSKTITIAGNETIQLEADEKPMDLVKLDKVTMKKYEYYFNSLPGIQVPLNKVFFSRHSTFYYGVPIDGDVLRLYDVFLKKYGTTKIISAIQADTSDAKLLAKDSVNYILVQIIKTPAKNILLGGAVGKDSTAMRHYYESGNLRTRILNEQ